MDITKRQNETPKYYLLLFWTWDQPSIANGVQIRDAANQFYIPISERLSTLRDLKVLLSVSPLLLDRLSRLHIDDVARYLRSAAENGTVELAGTVDAAMPLLLKYDGGEELTRRLMQSSRQKYRRSFGDVWRGRTFIPHQLAFSPKMVGILCDAGYETVVLDASAYDSVNATPIPHNKVLDIGDLNAVLRSDDWSNTYIANSTNNPEWNAAEYVRSMIHGLKRWAGEDSGFVVVGYNGEILRNQIKRGANGETINVDPVAALEQLVQAHASSYFEANPNVNPNLRILRTDYEFTTPPSNTNELAITLVNTSGLLQKFGTIPAEVEKSSWSSSKYDIQAGNPYPLVSDPENEIHQLLSEMMGILIGVTDEARGAVNGNAAARRYLRAATNGLNYGLHPSVMLNANIGPHWHPEYVRRMAHLLQESVYGGLRSLELSGYNRAIIPGLDFNTDELRERIESLGARVGEITRAA